MKAFKKIICWLGIHNNEESGRTDWFTRYECKWCHKLTWREEY